ncbi:MAG TPA: glycosyltransferase, partial [Herpetosiphonaceae bacterium]|nr:glycosyltransferase [Herpetosiphonaceae bacterium]
MSPPNKGHRRRRPHYRRPGACKGRRQRTPIPRTIARPVQASPPLRVLFVTAPGLAHWHPLVPVAQALQAAGHEVAVACSPQFAAVVEASGFQALTGELDMGFAEQQPLFRRWWDGQPYTEQSSPPYWLLQNMYLASSFAAHLYAIARAWSADVIVHDAWQSGVVSIPADLLGIPYVSCGGLCSRSEEEWRELTRILSVWRRMCGVPDDREGARIFPNGALVTMPMSYVVPGTHVPQSAVFIRPGLFDSSEGKHLPAWLATDPPRPLVAMTLGSVYAWPRGSVFQLVLEALAHEPITLVLVTGKNFETATLGPQPANVHIEQYVPFSQLFPRCDLVIGHGGWSTVLTALGCGVPQLVLPVEMEEDHHGNAERVVAMGAGRAIVY